MTHIPPKQRPVDITRPPVRPTVPAMALAVLLACLIGFLGGGLLGSLGVGTAESPLPSTTGPTPTPAEGSTAAPEEEQTTISLAADREAASPNERITLSGAIEPPQSGVTVQVQRAQDAGPYQSFPVTTATDDQGRFSTQVATRQSGENRFRVIAEIDGESVASDAVAVTVG